MGLLDRLREKEKEEKKKKVKEERSATELEQFLGDDQETYNALSNIMFLDPRKIDVSMKEATNKARTFEKDEDLVRARVWYEIAGGLAIYEGNTKKVEEYFGKCQKISPEKEYPILKKTKEAVDKAQEYYTKHLQH